MAQLVVVDRHKTMKMNVKVKFLIDNPKGKHRSRHDAENSALITGITAILKCVKIETSYFKL